MERFKGITIIILLAFAVLASAAQTKPASVLLQEGLYAEQIEGNLDAAIKIYEQVITQAKDAQEAVAQATYRIGMCYLKKGEQAKAASQFSNLVFKFPEQKAIVDKARKQLATLRSPTTVFEPVPVDELVKSGKVPCFEVQLSDNTALDLDSGEIIKLKKDEGKIIVEWPDKFEMVWDNDGGGALMIKTGSNVRVLTLPSGATDRWEDAISLARSKIDMLRRSNASVIWPSRDRFAAVLTSEGNLAVIQIGEYNPEQGTIYGWIEEISSFGPVRKRIVNDDGVGKNFMLDLDTGSLFSVSDAQDKSVSLEDFILEQGIDVIGETKSSVRGLMGVDIVVIPIANERWDISPEDVVEGVSLGSPGRPVVMSGKGELPATFIFKTKHGNMGVLQILEVEAGQAPRHVRIRYKMLRVQEPIPSLSFGSVTEFESKKTTWIDFESHSAYSGTAAKGKKSVDVKIYTRRDVVYLEGEGTTFALIVGQKWDDLTPYEVRHAFAQSQREESLVVHQYPTNYAFQTHEGRMGLLQVWGPFPARIRYKMLQERAKTVAVGWRKVFIPDADTRGANIILDLAGGELLPAGEGKQQLIGTFAELGKGDLAYDRALICLRGAKAYFIVNDRYGDHLVRLKVLEQRQDVTAYELELGRIPGCYLVTTGEDKDYEINILSADARGIELKYKKATGYEFVKRRFESRTNLLHLGLSAIVYAGDHNRQPPSSLQELKPYVGDDEIFPWILENAEYLREGETKTDQLWIAYDKSLLEEGKGTNVLFFDGHVEFFWPEDLKSMNIEDPEKPGPDAAKAMELLSGLKALMGGVVGAVESDDPNTALLLLDKLIEQSKQFKPTVKDTSVEAAVNAGLEVLDPLRDALERKQMGRAKSLLATLNQMGPAIESAIEKEAAQQGQSKKGTVLRRR